MRFVLACSVLALLMLVQPASASGVYTATATGSADGPASTPNAWMDVTRLAAGNWYINASAWAANTTGSIGFVNVKNLTVESTGWVDDAMLYASQTGSRLTLKMESTTLQVNFTFKNVPALTALKRNSVALPFTYTAATRTLSMTVNFSAVTITMDFVNSLSATLSSLTGVVVSLMTMVVVVSVFSGVIGFVTTKMKWMGGFASKRMR